MFLRLLQIEPPLPSLQTIVTAFNVELDFVPTSKVYISTSYVEKLLKVPQHSRLNK